jgi:hypothetical protein
VPAALRLTAHSCAPSSAGAEASLHPSIFIGGAGTRSVLHADDSGSRFMMTLWSGRKVEAAHTHTHHLPAMDRRPPATHPPSCRSSAFGC